jgi:uncharacterized protein
MILIRSAAFMNEPSREFQVFIKPAGSRCNLGCTYCYYTGCAETNAENKSPLMTDDVLEQVVVQHIAASMGNPILFSWHGGEPTLAGLPFFRRAVELQKMHCPPGGQIVNGIQTNGTLINETWARFLADEHFFVGISLDGPAELHNRYRVTGDGRPTHAQTLRGYRCLQEQGVPCEILCVVNAVNVRYPTEVYRYFKSLGAGSLTFLPLVVRDPARRNGVSDHTVPSALFGVFLCAIFDEWKNQDIGRIKVQIFEEAARTAFNQDHTLCIFKKTCGRVPVLEQNGDFYACDHFVNPDHYIGNIMDTSVACLLDSPKQKTFGQVKKKSLPGYCLECEVTWMCNGGCPKNRFIRTPDGEGGLNFLCEGYKRFFTHCRPFVDQIARIWQNQTRGPMSEGNKNPADRGPLKTGRNAPCPCGSGRKYKNCCLGKDKIKD